MFHLDTAGMDHQAAIERAEMEHMRTQSENTINIGGSIPQISRPHTSSSNLDRSRAGDAKMSPQHMKGVLLGGAWEMPGQQQQQPQQRRPGGFSRAQTWQPITTQLQDSRDNQQQHFTKPSSRIQPVISPQTTFETCVKLTAILFDLQSELGKTRSCSKLQGTFQSDNVFSAAASLCDVVEELIEESNSYNHQTTMPKFVFPISESGAPVPPDTKNDGTLNMLGNYSGDDILSVHRWLLSSCGCAMIINIYDAFCESFKNALDQSNMLLSAPSNTPDSGINIPTTTQTPSTSTSAPDYHHVHQRRPSSNFQSQTTMFNTNRLIQLTVMDFHLSKLERVFDVAICQGFLGMVEGKKLMQELRETLENLMARVKATWRV